MKNERSKFVMGIEPQEKTRPERVTRFDASSQYKPDRRGIEKRTRRLQIAVQPSLYEAALAKVQGTRNVYGRKNSLSDYVINLMARDLGMVEALGLDIDDE